MRSAIPPLSDEEGAEKNPVEVPPHTSRDQGSDLPGPAPYMEDL